MRNRTTALLFALPFAASCGSGDTGKEDQAAAANPEQAASANPEAGQAFGKLLECNSTTWAAYSLVSGEAMFAQGDERTALTGETPRRINPLVTPAKSLAVKHIA